MATTEAVLYRIITEVAGDANFFRSFKEDFSKRVFAQKAIYLLKEVCGVKLDWSYNWYISGPYSPSLARELYSITENISRVRVEANKIQWKMGAQAKLGHLRELLRVTAKVDLDEAEWAELLASIHYVSKWKGLAHSDPELVRAVCSAKPKFKDAQVKAGIRQLMEGA